MSSTTSTLSQLMQTYYDKLFVKTVKHWLVMEEGAQSRPLPMGEGKIVSFQRYSPLALITSALGTEGGNPDAVDLSATNITATVAEYGSYTKISKLLSLTAVDPRMKGAVEVFGQNAGESRDQLVRNELDNGTAQLAGAKAAVSDIAASDVLNSNEVRRAVRALKLQKAYRYADGYFLGKISPSTSYDLMGDATWVNAKVYSDVGDLYKGELGKLHGVRFLESTNPKTTTSTVTVYHNVIHGREAFGITELTGDEKKIYVKTPGPHSTDNPVDRFYTVGWAFSFVPKVIDANWIRVIKTGASA
jgi:N4-gp56 family major capsid protein